MATEKLNLYIVKSTPDPEAPLVTNAYLVIAENAFKAAQAIAYQPGKNYEQVNDEDGVGRLGSYEPGIEGHQITMQLTSLHKNGSILLKEVI